MSAAAVKGLTIAVRGLMAAFNVLFMVVGAAQLIGSFFDVDILGSITGWFKELGAEARKLEKAFIGVIDAASMDRGIKDTLAKRYSKKSLTKL